MNKVTTEDCKAAILNWYATHKQAYPGDFKRTKKFKNTRGYWVRLFEHAPSQTAVSVTEYEQSLHVTLTTNPGKGYLFAFCEDETFGDEVVGFVVVEKTFFEENDCLDSVHFTASFDMPTHFEEIQESAFIVRDQTEQQVRATLMELGFTESKPLAELMAG